ncbi:hypothetical protein HUW51_16945 [Adhaeribacter swui]|uniref:Uncharacterized protein n=1 Tax=Adhaeribacter swui TaxID=2086471 RepID=A0A7G7GAZ2_9BACT|nr:hypothetical protein [Adhaeribacter swui]QNF34326.1 hypothetical protein HUW51_16945 [Adhaeribacter swui]
MTKFNYVNFLNLEKDQVLKLKLIELDDWIYVRRVSKSLFKPAQPTFTPTTKINLDVIKDLDLYKEDINDLDNRYELKVEPEEVEQYELINIYDNDLPNNNLM